MSEYQKMALKLAVAICDQFNFSRSQFVTLKNLLVSLKYLSHE